MNLSHNSHELSLLGTFLPALTLLLEQTLLTLLLLVALLLQVLHLLVALLLQVTLLLQELLQELPALLLELPVLLLVQQALLLVQQALLLVLLVVALVSWLASQAPKSSLSLITPTMAVTCPFSKLMASTIPAPTLQILPQQPALLLKTVSSKSRLLHRC